MEDDDYYRLEYNETQGQFNYADLEDPINKEWVVIRSKIECMEASELCNFIESKKIAKSILTLIECVIYANEWYDLKNNTTK